MRLKTIYLLLTAAMLFCVLVSLEDRAYAYADPGSGLLLLQFVSMVFAGALFTIRKRIQGLIYLAKRLRAPTDESISAKRKD
jgi:hypothetical protein